MNTNHRYDPAHLDALLEGVPPDERAALRQAWAQAGNVPEPGVPGVPAVNDPAAADRVWEQLAAHIEAPAPRRARPPVRRPALRRVSIRWMALAAVVLAGTFAVMLWLQPVVHKARAGSTLTVALPDGSQVELNAGTTLRHARLFGAERIVTLEGEAFFDVVPGTRTFRVEAFNAQVEVLGTQFNVRAWPKALEPHTTVALASGRVRLVAGSQAIEMTPGEVHTVDRAGGLAPVSAAGTDAVTQALGWRTGALLYHDALLGDVLQDLERRFARRIRLQVPALYQRRVNLSLHAPQGVEAAVRTLCAAYALQYRPTTQGYELYDPAMD